MTRLTFSLGAFAMFAMVGSLAATMATGCGHPSRGEMPPIAPRPEHIDPAGSPAPDVVDPAKPISDAGTQALPKPTPVAQATQAAAMPIPTFAPDDGTAAGTPPDAGPPAVEPPTNVSGAPADAGTGDSYTPPLPPVPDAQLPDSRLEPAGAMP
jgi:hypothetical protein